MIPFVNVLIGTRGQFVKTAPILVELDNLNISYRLIHTGQHTDSTAAMSEVFRIRKGDLYITKRQKDITSMKHALLWFVKCIARGIFLRKEQYRCKTGYVMIHGDTLSTFIGLILAFFWRQKVIHIESGLTTENVWIPFPEEIIRRIVMHSATLLFAPDAWAYDNCSRIRNHGEIFCTEANTVLDALRIIKGKSECELSRESYGIVTLHRNETFYRKKEAETAVRIVLEVARRSKLLFIMHHLTKRRLTLYALLDKITENESISVLDYQSYDSFMKLVSNASFIITDGGGLQEESYYLNIPCLIMRKKTERKEGLDKTAVLAGMSMDIVKQFFDNLHGLNHSEKFDSVFPSKVIARKISELPEVC